MRHAGLLRGTSCVSHERAPPTGVSATTGAGNPKLDSLIDKLASTLDAGTRDDLLKQTQQIIASNAYSIFVGQRLPAVIAGPAWRHYPVPPANLWVDATTAPSS